jgi:hypothetical protein
VPEAERRQAKHDIRSFEDIVIELLRNARDAHAQRIFVATTREGAIRTLTMLDDGVGIPLALHDTVFEPRVTSKLETMVMDRCGVHGRGMALYSVRENVSSAKIAASAPHKGSSVMVVADTSELTERADQSTWPTVEPDETGAPHVARGPHNIVRRLVEFACEHPELELYIGTPTEVVATLVSLGRHQLDVADLMFCENLDRLVVWQRPAACADAAELGDIAEHIGMPISERTAHRILAGELAPLEPVLAQLTSEDEPEAKPAPDIYRWVLERLKLDAADCLAVEDSELGLAAASTAGLRCLVTPNAYTAGQDFGRAWMLRDSLAGIGPDELARRFAEDPAPPAAA